MILLFLTPVKIFFFVWNSLKEKGQIWLKLSRTDLTRVLCNIFCQFCPFWYFRHMLYPTYFTLHTQVHGRNFIECLILDILDTVVILIPAKRGKYDSEQWEITLHLSSAFRRRQTKAVHQTLPLFTQYADQNRHRVFIWINSEAEKEVSCFPLLDYLLDLCCAHWWRRVWNWSRLGEDLTGSRPY